MYLVEFEEKELKSSKLASEGDGMGSGEGEGASEGGGEKF